MAKADMHMHPLDHKYYFTSDKARLRHVVLDEDDKARIRQMVDWCVRERGLDVIAITDHDMIQGSLYAREYALIEGLPIRVVTGAECEVLDPQVRHGWRAIHLLCLGLEELPQYTTQTPVDRMAEMVREMGGTVIMCHPMYYATTFFRYAHLIHGYEYRNGVNRPFEEGRVFSQKERLHLMEYTNSDYHYDGHTLRTGSPMLIYNELNEDYLRRTFWI